MNTENFEVPQTSMAEHWNENSIDVNEANDIRKPRKPRETIREYSKRQSRKPDYVSVNYLRQYSGVSYPILKQLIEDNANLLATVHVNKSVRYSRVDIEQVLKIRIND